MDERDELKALLRTRNDEHSDFKKALKDDTAAVDLLKQAITALQKFYKNKDKVFSFVSREEPEYTVDQDKAPETSWEDGNYGGKKRESTGIVAILEMITEDTEKEMQTEREAEAKSRAAYDQQRATGEKTVDDLKRSKVTKEKKVSELDEEMFEVNADQETNDKDTKNNQKQSKITAADCDWVEKHYDDRASKRKSEISGLQEAITILAGGGTA